MLAGVKFISRDQIDEGKDEELDDKKREKRKSSTKKKKERIRKKGCSSSDDEGLEKIRKGSRKKKWYSSEEYSSSPTDSGSDDGSDEGQKAPKRKSKKKRKYEDNSESERKHRSRGGKKGRSKDDGEDGDYSSDVNIVRREMGLEWMTKPIDRSATNTFSNSEKEPEEPEPPTEQLKKANSRELNPYLKDNGSGYPEDADQLKRGGDRLLSSSLVGDGGASWRLKALKRAKEQAAREGRRLEEVVGERWGSLGDLAVSVASHTAAPSQAHIHAIKSRKMGLTDDNKSYSNNAEKRSSHGDLKDVSVRHLEMRAPKIHDSLSWGKRRKGQNMSNRDAGLISSTISSLNKFNNDGSFMDKVASMQSKDQGGSCDDPDTKSEGILNSELDASEKKTIEGKQPLSANQLAAKALQLRIKGKHEEAERLLKEAENAKPEQEAGEGLRRHRPDSITSRYVMQDIKHAAEEEGR
ncbi:hypothetical protein Ancab_030271 [Ancistrocladus abbreviatus]